MASYDFYVGEYRGTSIPRDFFGKFADLAKQHLERYKKQYTVHGDKKSENIAVCAMAETLYYYQNLQDNGIVSSVSVGSVSTSYIAPENNNKAKEKALYKQASLYLDIYRGVS